MKVYCKIDGKLRMYEVATDDHEEAIKAVRESDHQTKTACLMAVIK